MPFLIASLTLMATLVASQPAQPTGQTGGVSGLVIEDGTSAPVAGVRVLVLLDDGRSTPSGPPPATVTDPDGRFHFDVLPAGRYHIAAQKAGYAPPMDPSSMQMFEVSDGQTLEGLTVPLRRGGVISGRVLDPLGQPLAEVSVTALLRRLSSDAPLTALTSSGAPLLMPSGHSQTNDLGEFRIFGLPPGEYVIGANPQSSAGEASTSSSATTIMTSTFFPETADVSAAEPVTVQEGETVSDLTIRLVRVPAFRVSGVVVDQSGAPVAGAMVMLMGGDGRGPDPLRFLIMGSPGMSQSDASGRFTFGDVPAGSYTLRAGQGAAGIFARSEDFVIDGDGTPRAGPIGPEPAPQPGTIEVTVENANVSDLKIVVPASH
jgi:hypothetical protein